MAILCGRSCSFTVDGSSYTSHNVEYSMEGNETDVTAFGDDELGSWVVCNVAGTVSADFYAEIVNVLSIGDEVSLVLTLGYDTPVTITIPAVVRNIGAAVDAKGIAMQRATFRVLDA